MAFYVGYTSRDIKVEYLRWLTERGALEIDGLGNFLNTGKKNRPVFLWASGKVITQKEAEDVLGFKFVEVYAGLLKVNARMVEAALQVDPGPCTRPALALAQPSYIAQSPLRLQQACIQLISLPPTLKQVYYQGLPLGTDRLWRGPDKGSKYDGPSDVGKVHKVFIAYCNKSMLKQMIDDGTLIVQYDLP